MEKHAVYCATRNLYGEMETAAKSLIANSDVDAVHFLIEDAEFPRQLPDIIQVHDVSGQEYFKPDGPNARCFWTYMALMRAALCHVLPDADVVLSLDCDTICTGDMAGVWDTPLDGCYFAAVMERAKSKHGLQYANMGVTLFNLAKLRDGKADEVIEVLNKHKFTWPEQDAFNYLCQGRIRELSSDYNDMSFNGKAANPLVTHYASFSKDVWAAYPEPTRYRKMTWDEAMELHERMEYRDKAVMFTSDHDLERAENLRAVFDAYKLPKEFVKGTENMADAPQRGFSAVVCDTLPRYMPDKGDCKSIVIGHGIEGGKLYALDEKRGGIDKRAFKQIDAAVNASTGTVGIMRRMFGLPAGKVHALGMPRSDKYVGKRKGDGNTFLARYRRAYLYAPTCRICDDGGRLPRIDWEKLDGMLEDDETVVVKRHYFDGKPLVTGDVDRIAEVLPGEASEPYLVDCDVLLTDYSSILFDGYLLGKPCVLATDDMDAYLSTRGMYLDYPSQYSSRSLAVEGHEEELLAMLRDAAANGMGETENACKQLTADMCDGHASERVVELVRSMI